MHEPLVAPEWGEDKLGRRTSFPVAPWGTFSNVAYLLVGIWASFRGPSGVALAAALVALALGSGAFHGTAERWAQQLDRAGMHLVFSGLLVFALLGPTSVTPILMLAVGAAVVAAFVYLGYLDLDASMGIYLGGALLHALVHGRWDIALLSMVIFALAFASWTLDQQDDPPLGKYGHAVWHVLTAVAIWLMALAEGM